MLLDSPVKRKSRVSVCDIFSMGILDMRIIFLQDTEYENTLSFTFFIHDNCCILYTYTVWHTSQKSKKSFYRFVSFDFYETQCSKRCFVQSNSEIQNHQWCSLIHLQLLYSFISLDKLNFKHPGPIQYLRRLRFALSSIPNAKLLHFVKTRTYSSLNKVAL